MKKWLVINGSPRVNQNSDQMATFIRDIGSELGDQVRVIKLSDQVLATCKGCYQCLKTGSCTTKDDQAGIVDQMKTSDFLVLISPTYQYNVTAQMKTFLDRLFSQYEFSGGAFQSRLGPGKKAMVIGICAGDEEKSMGLTIEAMKLPMEGLDIPVTQVYRYFDSRQTPVRSSGKARTQIAIKMMEMRDD